MISGKDFRYVFDRFEGTFTSLAREGVLVTDQPVRLNLWRAPMDNDRNIRIEWEKAGYNRMQTKVLECSMEKETDGRGAVCKAQITVRLQLVASWVQPIFAGLRHLECPGRRKHPGAGGRRPGDGHALPAQIRPAAVSAQRI